MSDVKFSGFDKVECCFCNERDINKFSSLYGILNACYSSDMKGWGIINFVLLFSLFGFSGQAQAVYEIKSHNSLNYGQVHQEPSNSMVSSEKSLDLSCFVSANDAYGKLKSGWMTVDLRAKPVFEKFRVPGSINISIHALKSRSFLKKRKILLIDDGFNIAHLASLCQNLKSEGFSSVAAVFGGVVQWHQSGFPLEGYVPRDLKFASMSSDQFFQMKDEAFLHVIGVSLKSDVMTQTLFPQNVSVVGWKSAGKALGELIAKHKNTQDLVAIIFIDRDGKSYEKNIGAIQKKDYPIFFLTGGVDSYQDYLGKQQMIRERLLHPPQRRNFCGY